MVLELFTSQGCSSCPPADRLLGSLSEMKNVIALSFHVDYWNRLGWTDPFSASAYSRRQISYASALHSDVYTPQLIVNGEKEMIGSDSNKIMHSIEKAFSQDPVAALTIQSVHNDNGKATIHFSISGPVGTAAANIAIVEGQATTSIGAGENNGRTVTDYNIVRSFETTDKITSGDNTASIALPSSGMKNLSVVVYLQQKNNSIIAAARQDL
ncbi:MAG TPA: DUF1223 domain-containing protein [Chitinophagaceae bacterium]|nr:DUF1223 domain-containing protein [Chitinophagaceae bacterium]